MRGDLDRRYDAKSTAKWKRRIVHLKVIPDLKDLDRRHTRVWLTEFLQAPQDLRPHLQASMPRLRISAEEARLIAEHLIPNGPDAGPSQGGDPIAGRRALIENGCADCHAFTGVPALDPGGSVPSAPQAKQLAPDLRFVRARMTRLSAESWIAKPGPLMPSYALSPKTRRDMVAYLFEAKLELPPPPEPPKRLPQLERTVRYEEVQREVFKHVCWHCHSDPKPVGGDGGPGNTGGFGYPGKGIDLSKHAALGPELFEVNEAGVPKVVEVLLARHAEVAGRPVPGVLGMPLGLPPLSPQKIQLVDTWIAQGRKPNEPSGPSGRGLAP